MAILTRAAEQRSKFSEAQVREFIPFDPEKKCSEAIIGYQGKEYHVIKEALGNSNFELIA
jgi:hypothetical protein